MDRHRAEEIVESVGRAWDWVMEPETFELWSDAVAELLDADAAECGVVDLYKSQAQRPRIADIIEAYRAQMRRRPEPAQAPSLAAPRHPGIPAVPELAWSPDGARWAALVAAGMPVVNGVMIEGEARIQTMREEDVVRAEQQSEESYRALGATPSDRGKEAMRLARALLSRMEENIGGDSEFGRVCRQHNRWVGLYQFKDQCYRHVYGDVLPDMVDPDLPIALPPCSRCGGNDVAECGHLADIWWSEVDERTKALLRKRGEARDARRGSR